MIYLLLIVLLLLPTGEKTVIGSDRLQEIVKSYAEKNLNKRYSNVRLEFRSVPPAFHLQGGDCIIEVSSAVGLLQKGYSGIPVEIRRNGKLVQTIVCSVVIRTFEDVFLSAKELTKNEPVRVLSFEKKKIETTFLGDDIVLNFDQCNHCRAKRIIGINSVLRESMIEEIPSVIQNKTVSVIVVANNITIETTGIAKEEGRIGDIVKVQKQGSRQFVYGKVVGDQRVEIVIQ
jgi:flagella basal body P-ring formation protein FlgA